MTNRQAANENYGLDFAVGLMMGLLAGGVAGILFAPKPGRDLQGDIQRVVKNLPDELNEGWSRSKGQYRQIVDKTKVGIADQWEQRNQRRQAQRMAEAKLREEREVGQYDY